MAGLSAIFGDTSSDLFDLPEEHTSAYACFDARYNITELWDTANDIIGVDSWFDTKYGHQLVKESSSKYPRLHKSGETLNKLGGMTTLRFRGEDVAAESMMDTVSTSSDLVKYAQNRSGLSFILVLKLNAVGIASTIWLTNRGNGSTRTLDITTTAGNEFTLNCRSSNNTAGTLTTTGTRANDTDWMILSASVKYNETVGANSGIGYIRKNYVEVAANASGLFASTAADNTYATTASTAFRIGANVSGASYGRFNLAYGIWYIDYLTQTEMYIQEQKVANALRMVVV